MSTFVSPLYRENLSCECKIVNVWEKVIVPKTWIEFFSNLSSFEEYFLEMTQVSYQENLFVLLLFNNTIFSL